MCSQLAALHHRHHPCYLGAVPTCIVALPEQVSNNKPTELFIIHEQDVDVVGQLGHGCCGCVAQLWWVGKISNHLQAVPRCTHEMSWLRQHLGTHQDRVHAHKSESDKMWWGQCLSWFWLDVLWVDSVVSNTRTSNV